MATIQGQFDVSLSIPIDVAPDFPTSGLAPCCFQIEGDRITILPLSMTSVTLYSDGDYEPPKLTEIRVWISREIDLGREWEESLTLSTDDERRFEAVLVEATRHFVTIIKRKTNQWDLDTRHPVCAYNYAFSRADVRLGTAWPMEQGTKRLPEYASGIIMLHSHDFQNELTQDIWQEVIADVSRSTSVSLHDELLDDAKTFRSRMRYDATALYAAIASELMLERVCGSLLKTKGGLSEKQSKAKVSKLNIRQLLELIGKLDPSVPVKYENVRKLFRLRNRIAHGETQTVTWREANEALSTAEQLKLDLAGILFPLANR
jgi:hypothetical protein